MGINKDKLNPYDLTPVPVFLLHTRPVTSSDGFSYKWDTTFYTDPNKFWKFFNRHCNPAWEVDYTEVFIPKVFLTNKPFLPSPYAPVPPVVVPTPLTGM